MCLFCGKPGVFHDVGPYSAPAAASEPTSSTSSGTAVAALPAAMAAEVTYLSGVTSAGTIAATSFWTWNYNNPATYGSTSWAAKWGSATPGTSGGTVTFWFDTASGWTATEKDALTSGMALWSSVANINFAVAASAGSANFTFKRGTDGSAYETGPQYVTSVGSSVMGSHTSTGAVISIDTSVAGFGPIGGTFSKYGGYPYLTLVHEIGHLIGLGHGGAYNGSVNAGTQQLSAYDTRLWTVMSYINPWTSSAKYFASYPVTGTNWGVSADGYWNVPTTPMMLDILAIQQLYGTSTTGPLASGGQVYGFNTNITGAIKPYFDFAVNTKPVVTIWNGGINNKLDLSGFTTASIINLNPGTFSSAAGATNNIGIADGTVIETAIGGTGNDIITGNSYNNFLHGGAGGDTLGGGSGADTMTGGAGNDGLDGGADTDTAVYFGAHSNYQIIHNANGSWTITDLRSGSPDGTDTLNNIELLQFTDATYTLADTIVPTPTITSFSTDSGTVGDGLTNDSTLTLTGTATANSTVKVYDGATLLGSTTASAAGAWSFTTAALVDGGHSLTATAIDAAGNTSDTGAPGSARAADAALSVTIDTAAPDAPEIGAFSTDSGSDNLTNDNTLTLTGSAAANCIVKVYDGVTLIGSTTASADGAWSLTTAALADGGHSLTATATDAAGNASAASAALSVTIDTAPPAAPAIATFLVGGDGSDNTLTLAGSAAANSIVKVYDGGALIGTTTAGATGAWSFTAEALADGNHSFSATATDAAGNTSAASAAVNWYRGGDVVVDNLIGGAGDDALSGLGGNDTLSGLGGNDFLDGGTGADAMNGGIGNDSYVVDNIGDVVTENAGEGTDTVNASISYALTANVEHLVLTGEASINGTGNALANAIVGNSGDNLLNGGIGADSMKGGLGNDSYVVDNIGEVVTEYENEGTDTVYASLSYTLSAHVENLVLTGTAAINGTGNALANALTGNSGNNVLNGGAGADRLAGGLGNDSYVVDNGDDVVIENEGQGIDTVQASVSHALSAHVENLVLTGTAAINGTGNALANAITGNSGDNVLDGGAGNDNMKGGIGHDTYVVDAAGDIVTESTAQGTDTVHASLNYTLGANVENLVLIGEAAINGTGNTLANVITGNAGDNLLNGGTGADTMKGGIGHDTYVVDNVGDLVLENEGEGEGTDTVKTSLSYTLGANIENLMLTGSSSIAGTGNGLDNLITGNSGSNLLNGAAGADTMMGGAGNDSYIVDSGDDVVIENASQGTDTVHASVSHALSAHVENLVLTGSESINGTGNALANAITGNSGDNLLDGGAGNDSMKGGLGNDSYVVDSTGDLVTETAEQGSDTVNASVSYTLSAHVENLMLTGVASINGTGNALANCLTGNTGNNLLNGGIGADTMKGGAGNDSYVVDNVGDVVIETEDAGIDTVSASVGYALSAHVENLVLTGSAAINGTGNVLANAITGNSGSNLLDGGTGADTMKGGAGNDSYIVDDSGDVVIETSNQGVDTVHASVSHALSAHVENLVLTGEESINGTGNALANAITGNAGDNLLDGGAGNDSMKGGLGNDSYVVGSTGDVVTETAEQGSDTVNAALSYTLGANVENLVLTGTAAINGTGNGLDNDITGNDGANRLTGMAGADTLTGGAGIDTFIFFLGDGEDTVTDFDLINDVIDLRGFSAVGVSSFASLMTHAVQDGECTILTFDSGNVIALQNVQLAQLSQNDFLFS
jgi:Ca2+-binding RTX toxin-like protein